MEKPAESKKPHGFLLSLAVLVPSLVFTFLILGFSVVLITTVTVFLSTISILRFLKKRVAIVKNQTQKEQEQEQVEEIQDVVQSEGSEELSHIHEYQVEAEDFPSDSESSDDDSFSANGNVELSWMLCGTNVGQNLVISESSSVSDHDFDDQDGDDLIEISLPMSNSVDFNAVSRKNSQSNLADYLPEDLKELMESIERSISIKLSSSFGTNVGQNLVISESSSVSDHDFDDQDGDDLIEISLPMCNSVDFNAVSRKNSQSNLADYLPEDLKELWAELNEANEEDSLIEIDLSMDSIKAS